MDQHLSAHCDLDEKGPLNSRAANYFRCRTLGRSNPCGTIPRKALRVRGTAGKHVGGRKNYTGGQVGTGEQYANPQAASYCRHLPVRAAKDWSVGLYGLPWLGVYRHRRALGGKTEVSYRRTCLRSIRPPFGAIHDEGLPSCEYLFRQRLRTRLPFAAGRRARRAGGTRE